MSPSVESMNRYIIMMKDPPETNNPNSLSPAEQSQQPQGQTQTDSSSRIVSESQIQESMQSLKQAVVENGGTVTAEYTLVFRGFAGFIPHNVLSMILFIYLFAESRNYSRSSWNNRG